MKKELKKNITQIAKKNLMFRNIIRKMIYIYRLMMFKIRTIGIKVDEKVIIFGCFGGKSYTCSPKAIYEYMQTKPQFKDYKYIWAFREPEKYKYLEERPNTIVVRQGKKQYQKYLAKAKYWIFNYKIPEHIYPKKNQVFVQCWHGTPLKRLGCDLIHFDNALNTIKGIKKIYKIVAKTFTYFISPSRFATEKFISAWNLEEINKQDIIIEKGYPRNDFLYNYKKEDIQKIKEKLGIQDINKKILLYAPTYRGDQHESGVGYTYKEEVNFARLQKELSEEYIILFRPHYFVANAFDFEKYNGFVYNVADIDDVNELYIISDVLITDYSSVFFDYANLHKPMIFHMYDLEHYRDESNGFYIDIKELPGKITRTDDELIDEILRVSKEFVYNQKYKKFNEKYNYLDDGNASERVVNEIINQNIAKAEIGVEILETINTNNKRTHTI